MRRALLVLALLPACGGESDSERMLRDGRAQAAMGTAQARQAGWSTIGLACCGMAESYRAACRAIETMLWTTFDPVAIDGTFKNWRRGCSERITAGALRWALAAPTSGTHPDARGGLLHALRDYPPSAALAESTLAALDRTASQWTQTSAADLIADLDDETIAYAIRRALERSEPIVHAVIVEAVRSAAAQPLHVPPDLLDAALRSEDAQVRTTAQRLRALMEDSRRTTNADAVARLIAELHAPHSLYDAGPVHRLARRRFACGSPEAQAALARVTGSRAQHCAQ